MSCGCDLWHDVINRDQFAADTFGAFAQPHAPKAPLIVLIVLEARAPVSVVPCAFVFVFRSCTVDLSSRALGRCCRRANRSWSVLWAFVITVSCWSGACSLA